MLSRRSQLLQNLAIIELLESESEEDDEFGAMNDSESSSDEDLILYLLLTERSRRFHREHFVFAPGVRLDLQDPQIDCIALFRFSADQIMYLSRLFQIPDIVITKNRLKAHAWEALAILLNKLASPVTLRNRCMRILHTRALKSWCHFV